MKDSNSQIVFPKSNLQIFKNFSGFQHIAVPFRPRVARFELLTCNKNDRHEPEFLAR